MSTTNLPPPSTHSSSDSNPRHDTTSNDGTHDDAPSIGFYFAYPSQDQTSINIVDASGRVEYRLERQLRSTTTTVKRVGHGESNTDSNDLRTENQDRHEMEVASESDSEVSGDPLGAGEDGIVGGDESTDQEKMVADVKMHLYAPNKIALVQSASPNSSPMRAKSMLRKEETFTRSKKRIFTASSGQTYTCIPNSGTWTLQRWDNTEIAQARLPSKLKYRENEEQKHHETPDIELASDAQTRLDMDEIMTVLVYIMLKDIRRRRSARMTKAMKSVGDVLGSVGDLLDTFS
ncbi:hypothetical protein BDY19DRAFT_634868 [Irpex rosettiformis]|uniref:Uncharacterized protein n=1 Tax=Irpex rosettiformis TaxID=378272 RepID=A0ACB8UB28_9APHY|nr:hypothetical protein BDY19DRAFT_634868 [Irpex rosettiformis]